MEITITLTAERYDALTKTAELHLPEGTPEEYLQKVVDSACDSYAQTYEPLAVQVYKERAEKAEAEVKQLAEKMVAAEEAKAAAAEPSDSLADKIGAL